MRNACGISQGNLHLKTCFQSRSCGPARGRSNPSGRTLSLTLKLLAAEEFFVWYTFGMSNFFAFDKKHVKLLLESFATGMAAHITPIKYEALSPDSFLLLFRTTAQDGKYHYFVSLETDFQNSIEGARCTIEDWHGNEVIEFWPLRDKKSDKPSEDIKDYQAYTHGPYFAMLAEVKRPTHRGYWADSFTIMPNDKIGEKIKDFSEKAQGNIRMALSEVLKHKTNPNTSFLDSLNAQKKDTIVDDINKTDMAVTLYVQPDDSVELFYNYVNQTVGSKTKKSKGQTV